MSACLLELFTFLSFLIYFILSLSSRKGTIVPLSRVLSFVGVAIALLTLGSSGELFGGAYRVDLFSQIFKALVAMGLFLVLWMGEGEKEVEGRWAPEFAMFLTLSALGLMLLVSAQELITVYVALELSSFSLYIVIPLRRGQTGLELEAAAKYIFFGAISSGVMLYGMGYLYGLVGSTYLEDIVPGLLGAGSGPMVTMALVLALSGFFFKLALFPFHFWCPDVYEGASNQTTTFIATVPKIGAVALLIRLAFLAPKEAEDFVRMLILLSALSMTLGNIVGLVQRDIKRLLAYSGIAHAGYLLMGILALSKEGGASAIYYIAVYLFMNLGLFLVVMILSQKGENVLIDDLKGLWKRAPLLAFTLAVSAFSLAGIPPTGGFAGKLFVFMAAFHQGHLDIVIIGAVNTAISLFYYLNLVRYAYSRDPERSDPVELSLREKVLCYLFIIVVIFLGLFPNTFLTLMRASF